MADMVEYPFQRIIDRNVLDFIAPEQRKIVQERILSNYQQPYETQLVNIRGECFPVSIQGRTFMSGGKQVRLLQSGTCVKSKQPRKRSRPSRESCRSALPVKKIRDDQGYWNQLEEYIQRHSGAVFSHGLCKECTKKLYGNEKWFDKLDDKFKEKDPE